MFILILMFLSLNFIDSLSTKLKILDSMNMDLLVDVMLDSKSMYFLIILVCIVFNIYMFKNYYMNQEKKFFFFNFLFYWFVMSMIVIIYSNNWMIMILGWDMLGVSSYLLIVYYGNMSSFNSGFTTMNTNRLGDVFLISFIALAMNKNLINFSEKMNWFIIFLVICLLTKSAQFPFSSWLPLAMAAPTPISSLVHSSTLVTAGLFIFYKTDSMYSNYFLILILLMSMWTSIYSGLMGSLELDMKKMIALSTLSQLSFMFISFSLGLIFLSFLHLLTHAIFKASLFFWAGMNMHNLKSEQFFISFNFMSHKMSKSFFFLIFISLLGIPMSLGFYSKDQIIDIMKKNYSYFINIIFTLSIFITIIYTVRFMKKLTSMNFNKFNYKMIYFNLFNTNISLLFFSMLMLMSKYFNEHWFKSNYLMTTSGWKFFFLFTMMMLILINWFQFTTLKLNYFYKMTYINLFTMKILTINFFNKISKILYFDFGWLNKNSISFMKNNFIFSMNIKKIATSKFNIMFIFSFITMNYIL
uniref:NADH:ubiquinone reductase (H(+)-translocating) n=1 Tax=Echiniscus testudo TaxID=399800 RepID=A0A348BR59_ECHTS|nr:NADH dehydrogenase subunit 5 [Echiniscus testudo]